MTKERKDIPDSVKAAVWFADPEGIDWEREKSIVITYVLNHGTWEAVRWIYRFYGEEAIQAVVREPKRGLWFAQSLHFWQIFFGIQPDPRTFKEALISLCL